MNTNEIERGLLEILSHTDGSVDGREIAFEVERLLEMIKPTAEVAPKITKLYGPREQEWLTATTIDEAVIQFKEEWEEYHDKDDKMPKYIEVCRFEPMEFDASVFSPLDDILERLDEDYAIENGSVPTPAMKEAETVFLEAIQADYRPEAVVQVGMERVRT